MVDDAVLGFLVIPLRGARARLILQAGQAVSDKARPPLAHGGVANLQPPGDCPGLLAFRRRQDNPRAQGEPLFGGGGPSPLLQGCPVLFRQRNGGSCACHTPNIHNNAD